MSKAEPLVSICIPVYEGAKPDSVETQIGFLKQLFESILQQTYSNIEVVVSDQSKEKGIRDFINQWRGQLDLCYVTSDAKLGQSSKNLNNTLWNANGEFVKIIFQDDFFYDPKALSLAVEKMEASPDKTWGYMGIIYTDEQCTKFWPFPFKPRYNDKILTGANTIGCPSVLFLRGTQFGLFDENLLLLMDCEYYYRLHKEFGDFLFIGKDLVAQRIHDGSYSVYCKKDIEALRQKDLSYVVRRYNVQI